MKKIIAALLTVMLCAPLSGCRDLHEPNSIAYIVAIGVDRADSGNYNITIQFAKPVQISGSTEGGGGGEGNITENITIEAPAFFPAITMANQLVSKKFDLSHSKLIVFSEEIAREGISNFVQLMMRNSELRPNVYLAVSTCSAQEYLESVKPMIEINPVKYYQLIYENYNSIYAPNNIAQDFLFAESSDYSGNVLPLAGILPEKGSEGGSGGGEQKGSESGGSGGEQKSSGGGQESGGSVKQSAGSSVYVPENKMNFEYNIKNYVPGETPKKTQNKSEVIGMALFSDDKMIGTMGAVDCEIYNLIMGNFSSSYIPFKNTENDDIITIRIQQSRKPKFKIDTSGSAPKISVALNLTGEVASVPWYYTEKDHFADMKNNIIESTKTAIEDFLYKTSKTYEKDICSFGNRAKRNFMTNQQFRDYKWGEKYKDAEFEVKIKFEIERTGLILMDKKNKMEG